MSEAPDPGATNQHERPERDLELQGRQIGRLLDAFATEFLLFVAADGELLAANSRVILGYQDDEEVGTHIAEHLHPDDLPKVFSLLERARDTPGFRERIVVRARHQDGSWRTIEAVVVDAALGDSPVQGAVIRARQIDEELEILARHLEGEDLPEAGDRFLSLAEALPLGILSSDARDWVVYVNDAATQLLRRTADELVERGWQEVVHDEDREDVTSAARRALDDRRAQEATFRLRDPEAGDDDHRWLHTRFVPLAAGGRATGWIATIDDVTERQRATSQLAHLATHDPLTGLPNRLLLEDRLERALARLRREDLSVTVLFVDLDGFKEVNDDHGHALGDRALVEVAATLAASVREQDTVARLGGDEFVVLCEGATDAEAQAVQARIQASLGDGLRVSGTELRVGASIGSVTASSPDVRPGDLLAAADRAMYQAKRSRQDVARHPTPEEQP